MASNILFFTSLFLTIAAAAHQLPAAFSYPYNQGKASIPSTTAPSGVPFIICDNSNSYQNNKDFQNNLNIVLGDLSLHTPSPCQLVIKRETGTGSNKVYGFGQCLFTSLSASNCSLCIQRAIKQTSAQCPYAIGAKIIYDECLVSYGTQDTNSDSPEVILVNVGSYAKDGPFNSNLNKGWNIMKQRTPYSGKCPVALVTGNDPDKVYSFAQCENLSYSDCSTRFDLGLNAVGQAVGARIFYLNSFFRYENYSFYTGGVPFQAV